MKIFFYRSNLDNHFFATSGYILDVICSDKTILRALVSTGKVIIRMGKFYLSPNMIGAIGLVYAFFDLKKKIERAVQEHQHLDQIATSYLDQAYNLVADHTARLLSPLGIR